MRKIVSVIILMLSVSLSIQASRLDFANNNGSSPTAEISKRANIEVSSINGYILVKSDVIISKVDVFSAIGGIITSQKYNCNEVRIENLPKTYLVVRVTLENSQTHIYKIRNY